MCNKQIFKNCFWVPRDSGDLQNFFKNPKVSDLTPGRANINFYTKISLVSKVSRYQGKIGQRPITKKNGTNGCNTKLFGFAAISTIYETPFWKKKLLKNILYIILNSLFLRFRVRCYPVIRYWPGYLNYMPQQWCAAGPYLVNLVRLSH